MSKKQVPWTVLEIEPHRRLPVLHADFSRPCSAPRSSSEFIFFVPAELRPATVSILVSLISSHPFPSPGPPPSPTPRDNRLHTHTQTRTQTHTHTHTHTHTDTPPPVCPSTNPTSPCLSLCSLAVASLCDVIEEKYSLLVCVCLCVCV